MGAGRIYVAFWSGNSKERDHLENGLGTIFPLLTAAVKV
jgi:hypothetical protein